MKKCGQAILFGSLKDCSEPMTTIPSQMHPDYDTQAFPMDMSTQPEGSLPWLEYVQLLWFRKKLIIVITVFVGVIGYIQVNQIQSIYKATSTMVIGGQKNTVVDIDLVLSRDRRRNQLEGDIEVLRSRGLAAMVVERASLLNYPEFNPQFREAEERWTDFLDDYHPRNWIPEGWKKTVREALGQETERAPPRTPTDQEAEDRAISTAVNVLLGGLSLVEVEHSNVLFVAFSSPNPKLAALVANELPEAYIFDQMEAKFEATEKATAWLTEQLAELETDVAESERAVEIYRDEHGMTETSGQGILDVQLSELNSQLIVARAGRAEIEARLA